MHELKSLQTETADDVVLRCMSDELLDWRASIRGPPDTPYADVYFELILTVPTAYPLQPPTVSFATKVFHPNVHFKVRNHYFSQSFTQFLSSPRFCPLQPPNQSSDPRLLCTLDR